MTDAPLQLTSEWARLLVASLVEAGVRDAVISPGSRSTPFAIAASEHPDLRTRTIIDERSAAFFALGQARVAGPPTLLICTSGTAPAHYLPAVIEASLSFVPLIVLSADRPFELQDCGAPQTVDQLKLFGDHVRRFVELGLPDASPGGLRALQRHATKAVFDSLYPTPGPVHVNVRARKPLEPIPARDAEITASLRVRAARETRRAPRAWPADVQPHPQALDQVAEHLRRAARPLAVAGPAQRFDREAVEAFLAATGIPLLCDAASRLRTCANVLDASSLLLSSHRFRDLKPDTILQLGAAPTAAGYETLLTATPDLLHVVLQDHGWNDPANTADILVTGNPRAALHGLAARLRDASPSRRGWCETLRRANDAAWRCVEDLVDAGEALTEAWIARALVARLPEGAGLLLANSLPIRHVDACARFERDVRVYAQRGANGIDGLVSGAAGAASASGRPMALLIGDVSFLHDVGGLAAARELDVPLVIVILHNGGGRIFEQLPVAHVGLAPREMHRFTTPHGLTFRGAAELFALPYVPVATRADARSALDRALAHRGCTIIEATVPPHGAAELQALLFARVESALAPVCGGTS